MKAGGEVSLDALTDPAFNSGFPIYIIQRRRRFQSGVRNPVGGFAELKTELPHRQSLPLPATLLPHPPGEETQNADVRIEPARRSLRRQLRQLDDSIFQAPNIR